MLVPLLFACRGKPPGTRAADANANASDATASDANASDATASDANASDATATAPLGLLRHDKTWPP